MTKDEHIEEKAKKEIKAMSYFCKKQKTTSYTREEYKHSSYDGYLTSGSTMYLTEVKVREKYSNEQIEAFGGTYIEFKKLNGIINYKNDNDNYNQILYIVIYKDQINVYRLKPDPNQYTWELQWLPRNDFDPSKEWKHVAKLKNNDLIQVIKYK